MAVALRQFFLTSSRCCKLLSPMRTSNVSVNVVRGIKKKRWLRPVLRSLYWRRIEQGPEPERHRSERLNWSYDAEVYAFGKRLGEEFNEMTLRTAFTTSAYVESEAEKRRMLEADDMPLQIRDNDNLIHEGEEVASAYIKGYLRHSFPLLPEEGICGIHDFLMQDDTLAYISRHLGLKDLILTSEFPVSESTLSSSLKAVIGALAHDQGRERAGLFVQDFILTHLIGKDLGSMWTVINPMGLLAGVMAKHNRGPPEPRLMWATGSETVEAAYMVGIYSDTELIGQSPGETVTIAEEMAARDALGRIFKITDNRTPFQFGDRGRDVSIVETVNPSMLEYTSQLQ